MPAKEPKQDVPKKAIRYRKATPERLKELLERIGYKVTRQSTDGSWKLIRLPDGTPTNYWILYDRVEHKLDDNRGGAYFGLKDCYLLLEEDTVSVIQKDSKNQSVFVSFHNFETHRRHK